MQRRCTEASRRLCEAVKEYVSPVLGIGKDTEETLPSETQLELVEKVGEQNYLQTQMHAG